MSTNCANRNSIPLSLTILRTSSASRGASVMAEFYPSPTVLHNGGPGPLYGPPHVAAAHTKLPSPLMAVTPEPSPPVAVLRGLEEENRTLYGVIRLVSSELEL